MKQTMINYMKNGSSDEIYTPKEAVYPILPYLEKFKNKIFWECTDFGKSNITKVLRDNGFNVVTSHLNSGIDFLKDDVDFNFDIIITNPPYSLKDEFLKKAYSYNVPFLFLLPITSLEGIERGKMFREKGIEVAVFDRRINFLEEERGNWFNSSWFDYKIFSEKLLFLEYKKKKKNENKNQMKLNI